MAISPQQLKIYLTSAHRAVIFAIAQLSCSLAVCRKRFPQLPFDQSLYLVVTLPFAEDKGLPLPFALSFPLPWTEA